MERSKDRVLIVEDAGEQLDLNRVFSKQDIHHHIFNIFASERGLIQLAGKDDCFFGVLYLCEDWSE